jgi:hypothetical protein
MESVGVAHIMLVPRGGQDNDGDGFQMVIRLDLCEHRASVFPGQVQIEQNQIGTWHAGIRACVVQERHCFHAILHHMQGVMHLGLSKGFLGHQHVGRAVFHQQNVDGSTGLCSMHETLTPCA